MNNYRKLIFPLTACVGFIILFFVSPSDVSIGVRKGLLLCGETIIPSLFPFMILSDYLVRSGLGDAAGRLLSPATEKIFRLPGSSACAVLMSMIGGFPVGAKMISQLCENGSITERQGRRMIWFCVNSGPSFVISAVGVSMLSNKKCGIILFVSQTVTALLIGFFSRFFEKENDFKKNRRYITLTPCVLTESVSCSTGAMLNVCAWLLVFSGISPFLSKLAGIHPAFNSLIIFSEVTSGCAFAAKNLPLYFLAPVLCWSGLAVHMQLLPYLKKIGIPLNEFWLSRLVNCAVSLPTAFTLFKIFPCEAQVFSTFSEIIIKPYSVSVPASAAMLILGAFTIIGLNPKKSETV